MEPVSAVGTTAAAIGIATFAFDSILSLKTHIQEFRAAPEQLRRIKTSLEALNPAIDALKSIPVADGATNDPVLAELKKTGVAEAVNSCVTSCQKFNETLTRWTKHSTAEEMSKRDRFTLGVLQKSTIQRYATQIDSCKMTVDLAVSTMNLQVGSPLILKRLSQQSATSAKADVKLKDKITELLSQIHEQLTISREQQTQIAERHRELQEQLDDDDGSREGELNSALNENEKELESLKEFQTNCGVMAVQVESARTNLSHEEVLISVDSAAIVGIPQEVVGRINARFGKVTVTKGSKGAVGVFPTGFNPSDVFKSMAKAPAPNPPIHPPIVASNSR